jgi:hypothetical protein
MENKVKIPFSERTMDEKLDKIYDVIKKVYTFTYKSSTTNNAVTKKANNGKANNGKTRGRSTSRRGTRKNLPLTNKQLAAIEEQKRIASILAKEGIKASVANVGNYKKAIDNHKTHAEAVEAVRLAKSQRSAKSASTRAARAASAAPKAAPGNLSD